MEHLKQYLIERINTINQAIQILDNSALLKGEKLAFESILYKIEQIIKEKEKIR